MNTLAMQPTQTLSLCPSLGDIDAYIRWTQSIPRLSADRETELLERYHKQGDLSAGREFILAHLRFVVFITRGYQGYGLTQADLIQEGNIGLLKAFKRFDPEVGVRFVSFAVYWIKSEIQEFVLKNWRIVKIATTKAQRKLFFKMRSFLKNVRSMSKEEATSISQTLDVSEKEVWSMQEKLHGSDYSVDHSQSSEESSPTMLDQLTFMQAQTLEHQYENQQQSAQNIDHLQHALSALDERSRAIIQARWFHEPKKTLHTLSSELGVSAERIRQLENNALKKMKKIIPPPA